jgi:hypothetical protein
MTQGDKAMDDLVRSLSFVFIFVLFIYLMFYCRRTMLRVIAWVICLVLLISLFQAELSSNGISAGMEATQIIMNLRNVKHIILLAVSDDGRPPKLGAYDNAAFNEKYGAYMDRPLRADRPLQAQSFSFIIVLDDSTTGNVFTGFIAPQHSDAFMNDKGVRLKLAEKAQSAGLLKNIRGELYDGGDVIMMPLGKFPALKEGAPSGDLTLKR